MTYHGRKLTNEVIAEIADTQPSSVSYWCNAKKLMSYKYRDAITQALGLDAHYFDLEFSPEYLQDKARETEVQEILSSRESFTDASKINTSPLIYSWYQETYRYLLTTDFRGKVEELKAENKTAEVASLLMAWADVFRSVYFRLKPLVNSFNDQAYKIEKKYEHDRSNSQAEKELKELASKYDFNFNGSFDWLGNINFRLFTENGNPPPITNDKEV